jgi:hypothetical protein
MEVEMALENAYTIEAAATLLCVDVERIQSLVDQNLVDTVQEGGVLKISKDGLLKLSEMDLNNDAACTEASLPSKNEREKQQHRERSKKKWNAKGYIVVEEPKLMQVHEERSKCRSNANNLIKKARRLEQRINEYKAMELGLNAKFWKLAKALYPELWSDKNFTCEELDDGSLVIKEDNSRGSNFKEEFRQMMMRGIKEGHIPPQALGPTPPGFLLDMDDKDEDEEEEEP